MWAPAKFQVIYSAGTATDDPSLRDMPDSPVSQSLGGSVQVPAQAPSRFGMVFQGWGTNDLGTNGQILPVGTIFTMPGHNVTLTALWKAREFTITFQDGFDGTEDVQHNAAVIGTRTVPYGDSATLITSLPQHDHWLFDRWVVVDADGSESPLYETMLLYITANLTLRAKWKPAPKYSTTYVDEDGVTVLQEPIAESQGVPIPPFNGEDPTKAAENGISYTFDGWVLHAGTPGPNKTVGTTDLVYKASYKAAFIPYTVTYHWDSADVPGTLTPPTQLTDKYVNNPINFAPFPAVTGWTFNGWYTKTDVPVKVEAGDTGFTMPAGNVDLYGAWTHNVHTVSYHWDEGSEVPTGKSLPDPQSPCYYGETIDVAPDLSQYGWIFTGWYTKTGAPVTVGHDQGTFTMPNASVELYGRWEKVAITVTYVDEDGTSVLQAAINAFFGDAVPAFTGATPTKDDNNGTRYTFSGFTLSLGSLFGGMVGTTNLVFKATYSEAFIDYTVTYAWDGDAPDGALLPTPNPVQGQHVGQTFEVAANPVVTGWTFSGWHTASAPHVTITNGEFEMPAADVVLVGSWTQNNYKVTYAWDGTSPLPESALPPETTTNHYGDTIPVAADASAAGWTFIGWHTKTGAPVTVGDNDAEFMMPDGDVTLYGRWTAIDYTVTYKNWDGEVLQGPDTVHIGDAVIPYASTNPTPTKPDDNGVRYTFTGWELIEGELLAGKVGTTDLVYQAVYGDALINYTVTYHWEGLAPDAAGDAPAQLTGKNVNNEINLVFPATITGWTFNGWYTKTDVPVKVEAGDTRFTMPAGNVDLYGSWTHKEHTITYAWEDANMVPDGHTVPGPFGGKFYGETIIVADDQAEPGWVFTGWHTAAGEPLVTVGDDDATFVMPDDDLTLYGSWERIVYTVTYENWDGTELHKVEPLYVGNAIPGYDTTKPTPTRPDANGVTYTFKSWTLITGTPGAGNTIGTESLVYRADYDSELIDYTVSYAWEIGSELPVGADQLLPDDTKVYHFNDDVTVFPDAAAAGWIFTGWHTMASDNPPVTVGDNDTTFKMAAGSVTLYGSWTKIDYTVTYVDEDGTTELQAPITVNIGDDVPAYTQPNPTKADNAGKRYTFDGFELYSGTLGANGKVGSTNLVYKATYSWVYIDYTVTYAWESDSPLPPDEELLLPEPQTGKNIGNTILVADDAASTGWTFIGWHTESGAPVTVGDSDESFVMPNDDVTLYGRWTHNEYTVSYKWDSSDVPAGHSVPPAQTGNHYNEEITVALDPTEPGWIFTGWHTRVNEPLVTVGDDDLKFWMPDGSVTLYGSWAKIPYTVTYVDENGTTVLQSAITAYVGDTIPAYNGTTPTKPDNNGITYTFAGFELHSGTEGANGKVGTMDLVYIATYGDAKIDYRVDYAWDGAAPTDAVLPPSLTEKHIGEEIDVADAPVVTGWTFTGWYTKDGAPVTVVAGQRKFTMPAGNVVLYGRWSHNEYTVSYEWDTTDFPEAQKVPDAQTGKYYNDEITVATDPAEPGWTFIGWHTAANETLVTVGDNDTFFMMPDGSVTLYGSWAKIDYTVTYVDEDGTTELQAPTTVHIGDDVTPYTEETPTKADNAGIRYTFDKFELYSGTLGANGKVGSTNLVYRATYSWVYIDYTVTYAWDGDAAPGAQLPTPNPQTGKNVNNVIDVADAPAVTGWTFNGWYTKDGSPVTVVAGQENFVMPNDDVTLYGSWTQNNYKVTYAWENASPLADSALPTETTTNHYGETVLVAPDLSAPGWVFTGWHTLGSALVAVGDDDESFTMPDGDVTLYGSWAKIPYTVTYVDENGTTVLQAAITAYVGDTIPAYNGTTPTKPDNNGITYTFAGFELHSGTEGANGKVGTMDLVYIATYGDAKIDYRVDYAWDGAAPTDAVLPPSLTEKHIGEEIDVADAPVVTGWTFTGWYTKDGAPVTVVAGQRKFTMPAGNVVLYGRWSHNEYTVSYEWDTTDFPEAQKVPDAQTGKYYNDEITVATDPAEPGWTFIGWHTAAGETLVTVGDNDLKFWMPDGSVTLYGSWAMIDYTVTYVDGDGTTELQAPITVHIGDDVPAYTEPNPTKADNAGIRYTFDGFVLDSGTLGANGKVGSTNLVYKATYKSSQIDYTVTYAWESDSPLPPNHDKILPGSVGGKHINDPIAVEGAPVATGWTFTGWYTKDGSSVTVSSGQTSFVMPNDDVVLYGSWSHNPYSVTYAWQPGSPVPNGQAVPVDPKVYYYGVTVEVMPDLSESGWVFTGWHTAASGALVTVGDSDETFTMPDGSVTLYGRWEKLYTITYVNWDDTPLGAGSSFERLAGEAIPDYAGATPTKPDNNGITYTWAGTWTLISGTTGGNGTVGTTNLVFRANYSEAFIDYSVSYAWEGSAPTGAALPDPQTGKNVGKPITVEFPVAVPGWTFTGWYTKDGSSVTVQSGDTGFTMPAANVTLYGYWTQKEHKVSYKWESTAPTNAKLPDELTGKHYNEEITVAPDPTEPGWTFTGWHTKAGETLVTVGDNDTKFMMPDGSVTLYGSWAMIDYTVTYQNWDGATLQGPTTVHVGDAIPGYTSATPTRLDNNGVRYTFTGNWTLTGTEGPNGTVGTTNLVYKATYSEAFIDYSVIYAWETGSPLPSNATQLLPPTVATHHVNEAIDVAAKPVATGWTFTGWYTKDGSPVTVATGATTFTMPASNVVLYGSWTQNEYKVTYAYEGTVPTAANVLLPGEVTSLHYGEEITIALDPVLAGYDFDGWYTKTGALVTVGSSDTRFFMPDGSVTLYGKWTQKNHTVFYTWDGSEPAGASLPLNQTNCHYNDTVRIIAPSAVSGWLFLGWVSQPGASPVITAGQTSFTMPDGDVTLVGSWEKLYNLTYAWDRANGAMVPPTASLPIAALNQRAGTMITLAAKPAITGWEFEGWYTKDANGNRVPLYNAGIRIGTADVVIYGIWTKIGTLTVTPYAQPYDGAAHGIGVVGEKGDTISYSLDGSTWTDKPILRTDVQSAETVYVRAEQAGYKTRYANATITITPRVLSYRITAPATVYYGDGATVGYTLTNFAKGESLANLPGLTAAALEPTSPIDVLTPADANSPHTVRIPTAVAKYSDGSMKRFGNYVIDPIGATITVMPRPITLTADNYSKYVGVDEPVYTYTMTGTLVNGDVLTTGLKRTDMRRDPGDYAIDFVNVRINGVDYKQNGNYVITLEPGTLTIKAYPTFTLTFIVRGGPYGSTGLTVYTRELLQGNIITMPSYTVPEGYSFSGFSNVPEKMPPHALTIYGDLFGGPETRELEEPEIEWIEDDTIPLAAPNYRAWSLVNLIVAILTAFGAVLMLLGYLGKKRREANPEKGIKAAVINRKGGWRLASLIPGLGAIIAFLLTENMSDPVVLLDSWTPLMVVIALIQVGVAILAGKKVTEIEPEPTDE